MYLLDAQRALLRLLVYMGEGDRFVPGARLYDSYVRDLILDSYEDVGSS